MTAVTQTHIWLDDHGVAWIDDTKVKVIQIAAEWRYTRASPEEIEYQHYSKPSLGQIFAALAYYMDHQAELDAVMDRQEQEIARRRAASLDSPGRRRLRALGKLP